MLTGISAREYGGMTVVLDALTGWLAGGDRCQADIRMCISSHFVRIAYPLLLIISICSGPRQSIPINILARSESTITISRVNTAIAGRPSGFLPKKFNVSTVYLSVTCMSEPMPPIATGWARVLI